MEETLKREGLREGDRVRGNVRVDVVGTQVDLMRGVEVCV